VGGEAVGHRRHWWSDTSERRRRGAGDRGGWREDSHKREWVITTEARFVGQVGVAENRYGGVRHF
jgi:hypothetical protein